MFHRSMGGMRSGAHLKDIVGVLHNVIQQNNQVLRTWGLHSLNLTIEAAGGIFIL